MFWSLFEGALKASVSHMACRICNRVMMPPPPPSPTPQECRSHVLTLTELPEEAPVQLTEVQLDQASEKYVAEITTPELEEFNRDQPIESSQIFNEIVPGLEESEPEAAQSTAKSSITTELDISSSSDNDESESKPVIQTLEYQLEAHPLLSNRELLEFNIRSRNILWRRLIIPLKPRSINSVRNFGADFKFMTNTYTIDGVQTGRTGREILVCHDMMGNYLEDRYFSASTKWDGYRFFHWSGIDYFCYFSHNYITIPPSGWINAAHLHGVKILGTFITENSTGTENLLEVLESQEKINHICNALVGLCEHFCFEGWLINIECTIPSNKIPDLRYFLRTLKLLMKQRVPYGVVFWYDSIIKNGAVLWQNEINSNNMPFVKLTDATLVNYTWNELNLQNSISNLQHEKEILNKAFFGIDIFGRGQIGKFKTNETLAKLDTKLSVGFFAPGWTYESLQNFGYQLNRSSGFDQLNESFLNRNDHFWWKLWPHLPTHAYSHLPFYTSFCLGSGKKLFQYGQPDNQKEFFNLNQQQLQPSVPLSGYAERYYEDGVNGGSSLRILKYDLSFRIFATELIVDRAFIFAYAYKLDMNYGQLDLLLRVCTEHNNQDDCYIICGDYFNTFRLTKGRCYISPLSDDDYPKISAIMERENATIMLPFTLQNGWCVRYYGVTVERPLYVRDIGVLYRRYDNSSRNQTALLGAVYFNSFSMYTNSHDIRNWIRFDNELLNA